MARDVVDDVEKSPVAKLWYGFDWAALGWLADLGSTVTIGDGSGGTTSPAWTITAESDDTDDTPLLVDSAQVTNDAGTVGVGSQTWVRLKAGTAGRSYLVNGVIHCSDGSIDERTFRVRVQDR